MLQALKDTDPWEAEDIDEILNAADASGDGELQIEDVHVSICDSDPPPSGESSKVL